MKVTLQYFDGCPNWKEAEACIKTLRAEGFNIEFDRQLIETPEAAEQCGFRGSPTIVIDGDDPFADPGAPVGLSCRVYQTENGYAGSPTLDQLRAALEAAG
jgi:hypothetical protein